MLNSIKLLIGICKAQKKSYSLSIIFSILSVISGIIAYYGIYIVINYVLTDNDKIVMPLLYITFGFLGKYLFFSIASVKSHQATAKLLVEIRTKISKKMEKISLGDVRSHSNGYYKKLLVEDVESLEKFLAHNVTEVSSGIGVSVLLIILFIMIDWRLAIAATINIPISYKILSGMMSGSQEKMENYAYSLEKMNGSIIEYVHGMNVIKAYHCTDDKQLNLEATIETFRFYVVDWYHSCWKYMSGYAVGMKANLAVLLPVGGILFLTGSCNVSKIIFFLMMSFSFSVPLTKLGEFTDTMPMLGETYKQIEDYMGQKEMENVDMEVSLPDYTVKFKNVTFHYEENIPAVKNLSFTAYEKEITALVGESGSGKSTTAKLAARFWDVDKGEIFIGGISIKKIPVIQLMEIISFVFQDSYMFNDTIENNIRIGKPNASYEELMEAVEKAACKEVILEKGFDAMIGGKDGIRLSGGEKQRIALARAILKNSPILILDEATASSDAENQLEIQKAISSLAQNKTVLTIAHRLSSIVDADKILVFSHGEIVETGIHAELMNKKGSYSRLYKSYLAGRSFHLKGGNSHV